MSISADVMVLKQSSIVERERVKVKRLGEKGNALVEKETICKTYLPFLEILRQPNEVETRLQVPQTSLSLL